MGGLLLQVAAGLFCSSAPSASVCLNKRALLKTQASTKGPWRCLVALSVTRVRHPGSCTPLYILYLMSLLIAWYLFKAPLPVVAEVLSSHASIIYGYFLLYQLRVIRLCKNICNRVHISWSYRVSLRLRRLAWSSGKRTPKFYIKGPATAPRMLHIYIGKPRHHQMNILLVACLSKLCAGGERANTLCCIASPLAPKTLFYCALSLISIALLIQDF